jgi:hypothetical protein
MLIYLQNLNCSRNTEGDCKVAGRMGKTALLLGATGETGRELLRELVHAPAFDKVSKAPVGPCTGI